MKIPHRPHHWIPVALVLAASLLTLTEVWGQHTGPAAVFEGRPAMSGAQAGTGPMAGPPQGGIGVQTNEDAQLAKMRRANTPRNEVAAANGPNVPLLPEKGEVAPPRDHGITPRGRDTGVAKDQKSATKKVKKASKQVKDRVKHPTSDDEPKKD